MSSKFRVLEWFSGIGGLHYGLLDAAIPDCEVVASFDINELANKTYEFNFKKKPITVFFVLASLKVFLTTIFKFLWIEKYRAFHH